ncbi:peptidase inhibitor family I36 protein [Streptomyces sp. NPDC093109]|uniref:peptidase inhibitor family I36 protein n=1 Tax=Streptomyces sp. NPDC093109 TaxID=3154977 RepID=UPI00344ED608
MKRISALAAAAIALAAAFSPASASASATSAPTEPAAARSAAPAAAPAAYNCTSGYFCIYSDWNGGGTRCQWSSRQRANTADDCSFIQRGQNVKSVWNGTDHRVQYYTQTNYNSRVGSTTSVNGGNLQGNYQIRSFKPQ